MTSVLAYRAILGLTRVNSLAMLTLAGALQLPAVSVDLTVTPAPPGGSGYIGPVWFSWNRYNAGTGLLEPFYRLSQTGNNTTCEGYNASARPVMPDVNTSGTWTKDVPLRNILTTNINGIQFYQLALDINQHNSDPFLSLDKVQLFLSDAPIDPANTYAALTSQATMVYDMDDPQWTGEDNEVLLNFNLSPGSGYADMIMLVPADILGANGNRYLTLYSHFGGKGGIYAENDGFEEWSTFGAPLKIVGALGDTVWYDCDGDGFKQPSEPGIPGVMVFVDLDNNGVRDGLDPFGITDSGGVYMISNLVAGTYSVRVNPGTLPANVSPTYDLDGIGTPDVATGTLAEGQVRLDFDFGYRLPPPTITCAPAKNVECGTVWDFDAPGASSPCGTSAVTVLNTVTNTLCGGTFSATRTWVVTSTCDPCLATAQCSQTVTVVDTTTPQITCASDKTVACGAAWDFDAPTANDTCGSATVLIVGTVTNAGPNGTLSATRTWRAVDDCSNGAECSQTVTVEPCFSLGNRVFVDDGSGGGVRNNGLQDGSEPGLAGVKVNLYADDGAGEPGGPQLGTQVTDSDGWYRFDGLASGSYVVVVDVVLSPVITSALMVSSTGFSVDMTLTGDLLDHGKDTPLGGGSVLAGGIASAPVALGLGVQPTGEATGTGQGANGPTGDVNDNLVVDFGFVPPLPDPVFFDIGNRVFLDDGVGGGVANNGLQDGTEQGIAGVTVRLFLADVNGEPTGVPIDTQLSDADGWYRFDGLPAGTYVVVVDVSASFLVLNGMTSSTGFSTALTLAGDLHDHGKDVALGLGTALPGGIASGPVTVGPGLQPLGEEVAGIGAGDHGPSGDANDNLVVDFGFYRPSVTLASISGVSAEAQAGQVTVRWYTAIEIGTIAYDLERQLPDGAWLTVNPDPVFAWNSMVGASYAVADAGARARQTYLYRIVEYMDSGEVRRHGPYAVAVSGEPGVPVRITACEVVAGELRLTWEGGAGSYVLERSASLGADASWEGVPLAEPTATEARLPVAGSASFFRVYRVD
jgi:hypothetical protein